MRPSAFSSSLSVLEAKSTGSVISSSFVSNAALSAVLIQTVNASRMRILADSGDMFKAANGSVSLQASIPSDSYVNSRATA